MLPRMVDSAPTPEAGSLAGRVLDDRYRITHLLGSGSMSVVYRAEQPDGPSVGIKVLHRELGDNRELRERFQREARALFGLQHPHVLEVLDFGIVDGAPYLVMELLDGQPLDAWLEASLPDPDTAVLLARQILSGLAYAHAQGALHRDLKTENVFVTRGAGGRPAAKILDFGLVKFVDEDRWGRGDALTAMGSVFGTPAYMSPEQACGSPVDARSDVYAAGVVLFELLTGLWPFVEEERTAMFRAHLVQPPPTVGSIRTDVTVAPELETLLQTALAKRPDDRFRDAGRMLEALDALPRPFWHRREARDTATEQADGRAPDARGDLGSTAVLPGEGGAAPDPGSRSARSARWLVAALGLVALVVLATAVSVGIW